jgi:hypothetical protein
MPASSSNALVFLTLSTAFLLVPLSLQASPWTLPANQLTLIVSQDFQYADHEFLPDGRYQAFPLNGAFRSANTRLLARYGFTDRFEGGLNLNLSIVSYQDDPLILEDFPDGATSAEVTDAILNFNSVAFGAGDVHLYGNYNLYRGPVLITSSTSVKLPTGYAPPSGTFRTTESGETVIGGQTTLGDGQTDITQLILLGTYIPITKSFARLDAGLRFRAGSPGHQALANLRVGQFFGDRFILTAGFGWLQTITEGDVIGESFIATDPSVTALEFTPDNVEILDLRLDQDALSFEAGLIFNVRDLEFIANYSQIFRGTNVAQVHSFSVSTIFSLPGITGD